MRDEYEEKITFQERIVYFLDAQVSELERNEGHDSLLSARLYNRKTRLQIEQNRLNDFYSKQSKLNDCLNIIDTCYKPAVDRITVQCRGLLPIAKKYYNEWLAANPAVGKQDRAKSSWDDCFCSNVTTRDTTKITSSPI